MNDEVKVNIGYDRLGRPRNRYFPSLEVARKVVNDYFCRTKIMLAIESSTRKQKHAK